MNATDPARRTAGHDPVECYGDDGTDLTLIRWMLSLSSRERLEVLQASADSLRRLRERVRPEP